VRAGYATVSTKWLNCLVGACMYTRYVANPGMSCLYVYADAYAYMCQHCERTAALAAAGRVLCPRLAAASPRLYGACLVGCLMGPGVGPQAGLGMAAAVLGCNNWAMSLLKLCDHHRLLLPTVAGNVGKVEKCHALAACWVVVAQILSLPTSLQAPATCAAHWYMLSSR